MPKSRVLPFEWYETPNIHLTTIEDFLELCREEGITILDRVCLAETGLGRILVSMRKCNLGAGRIVARITKVGGPIGSSCACRTCES